MSKGAMFTRLIEEYGNSEAQDPSRKTGAVSNANKGGSNDKEELDEALMQAEERMTGAVSWKVYQKYLQNAGGVIWAPIIIILLLLTQATNGQHYASPQFKLELIYIS